MRHLRAQHRVAIALRDIEPLIIWSAVGDVRRMMAGARIHPGSWQTAPIEQPDDAKARIGHGAVAFDVDGHAVWPPGTPPGAHANLDDHALRRRSNVLHRAPTCPREARQGSR